MPFQPDAPYDAVLRVLDRQVIGTDDLNVCKVDDIEVTDLPDGSLQVTALLAGTPALLPRLAGRPTRWMLGFWERMGAEQADRHRPYRIPLELVDDIGTDVRLNVPKLDVLERADLGPGRHPLRQLLALQVHSHLGDDFGHALDVRVDERHRIIGVIAGAGRPGSLLGYDRHPTQGPAVLRWAVGFLHRHTVYIPWEDVEDLSWETSALVTSNPSPTALRELPA